MEPLCHSAQVPWYIGANWYQLVPDGTKSRQVIPACTTVGLLAHAHPFDEIIGFNVVFLRNPLLHQLFAASIVRVGVGDKGARCLSRLEGWSDTAAG